jgi:hypothetical protein
MAKTTKTAAKPARLPAKEQMANRTRVSFGSAFIRDCKAGVQRDVAKVLAFAIALGLGSAGKLKQLKAETVAERVKNHLDALPANAELPKNAKFVA